MAAILRLAGKYLGETRYEVRTECNKDGDAVRPDDDGNEVLLTVRSPSY